MTPEPQNHTEGGKAAEEVEVDNENREEEKVEVPLKNLKCAGDLTSSSV